MSEACNDIQARLGEFVDGELPAELHHSVAAHLAQCPTCRAEHTVLRRLADHLGQAPPDAPPAELWGAIEARLSPPARRVRPGWGRLLAAAAVLLVVGLGWLAVDRMWDTPATAAVIDFRPLLERADGDVGAGVQALIHAYGGEALTLSQARARMTVRVHAPPTAPGDLQLAGCYLLNMGDHHRSLAFHYAGAGEKHLLLLQCPPNVEKKLGNHECMPCALGGHSGEAVQVGKLRLMHMMRSRACICIVSTLEETGLAAALDAIPIDP